MATNWPSSVQTFTNPTSGSSLSSPSHADQHATVNDTVEALQNYAGLVFVKSVTVGSGVSSVTVTNAFDSRFDNYRVLLEGTNFSIVGGYQIAINMQGSGSGSWYGTLYFDKFDGSSTGATRFSASTYQNIGMQGTNSESVVSVDIYAPYLARRTSVTSQYSGDGWVGWTGGQHAVASSYTGFVISPNAGTMTGGTIRVYGYNNGA